MVIVCTHMEGTECTATRQYENPRPRTISREVRLYYPEHHVAEVTHMRNPSAGSPEATIVLIDNRERGVHPAECEFPVIDLYVDMI